MISVSRMTENEHLGLLRKVCSRFVSSEFELNELLSETWIKTRELEEPGLIRVSATNRILDLLRKRKREREGFKVEARLVEDPSPILEVNEIIERAKLDQTERDLVFRRFYLGRTLRELADDYNRSHSWVKVRFNQVWSKIGNIVHSMK